MLTPRKRPARVIVKLGTGVLTSGIGRLDTARIASVCAQIAALRAAGTEVLVVSSGAVGLGMGRLALTRRPSETARKQACAAVGCFSGTLAVLGGPHVYSYFLKIGYDDFYLSRADKVRLPGGVPVFGRELPGSPEEIMAAAGLKAGPIQRLDDEVSLVEWTS